jgi:CRISPR type I-E-associated protein CasA/Cse1
MNYNLLEEQWIPVLYKDGKLSHVNILDAFAQASRIREIAAGNPMDRFALLRFLLALLYWCRGNPPVGAGSIPAFPSDWFKRLDDNRDCFNLLGNGKRFYQYGGDCGTKLSVNYLMQEVPTGTNLRHFRHSTDYNDGLCTACCALGLLRLPAFATQGGQGKSPGINQKPPVYVTPLGDSLAETLRLTWRKVSNLDLGTPAWESSDVALPKRGNVPLLVGLTWLPRRVWLEDPLEPESRCIACASWGKLIRQCVFAGLGSAKAPERVWNDPHTVGEGDKVLRHTDALGTPDAEAGEWARVTRGILGGQSSWERGPVSIVSFATDQNKFIEAKDEEISLPEGGIDAAAVKIEVWDSEARALQATLRNVSRGKRRRRKDDARLAVVAIASIRPHVEATVSARAGELVSAGDDAWQQAAREYTPMMKAISQSLSPGYTTAALRRRREIGNVRPDMRPKTTAARKGGRKKRGAR